MESKNEGQRQMTRLSTFTEMLKLVVFLILANRGSKGRKISTLFCQFDIRAKDNKPPENFTFENIPGHLCTDLLVGFFKIDHRRLTFCSSSDCPGNIKGMKIKLRYNQGLNPGLKKHLTVGFPDSTPPNRDLLPVVSNLSKTKLFVHLVAAYLRRERYDGINVYWASGDHNSDQDVNLLRFLSYMDTLFREPGLPGYKAGQRRWSISVTVAGFPLVGSINSTLRDIHQYIDYLIVKAFDVTLDSTKIQTYTHPLYLRIKDRKHPTLRHVGQAYAVTWWEAVGIPMEKIVLACPTYARILVVARGRARNGIYDDSIIVSHGEACRVSKSGVEAWRRYWDPEWGAHYMTRKISNHPEWIFYNTDRGIQARCEWVLRGGYSGLMMWTMDKDDFTGVCGKMTFPVITSAQRCLKQAELPQLYPLRIANKPPMELPWSQFYLGIVFFWLSVLGASLLSWYATRDEPNNCGKSVG